MSPVDAAALTALAAITVTWAAALAWAAVTAPVPAVLVAAAALVAVVVTGTARETARDWLAARERRTRHAAPGSPR